MRGRIVISALIFIILCAAKFLFPEGASDIRNFIVPTISRNANFREDFIAIGRALSGEGDNLYVWERLINAEKEPSEDTSPSEPDETQIPTVKADVSDSFVLSEMVSQNLSGYEAYAGISIGETTEAAENQCEAAELPENQGEAEAVSQTDVLIAPETIPLESSAQPSVPSEKIEEFLKEQSAFANYAVPANVSYDAPPLPFEYSSPSVSAVTSGFGYREHPIDNVVKFHYGTDLGAYDGDPITAFADGTVISVQEFDGYGLTVMIEHSGGFSTLYAHCSQILVEQGDVVKRGDKIALVGHSGNVTGPHLHFELMYDGKYLNPEFYL